MRVDKEAHDEAAVKPGARIFDLSAKPMRRWIVVSTDGIASETLLKQWIAQGVVYASSLPAT